MKQTFYLLIITSLCIGVTLQSGCATTPAEAFQPMEQTSESSSDEKEATKLTTGPKDSKKEKVSPGKIDFDAKKEFKKTDSGLEYRILRKGDGDKPKATDTVTVHYKGWLDNKTVFDSSYRGGETISFPLNRVVKGWTEGLQLVKKGGMIELKIPYQLGYGERGTPGGPIPPKATLHFIVELFEIK